MHLLVSPSLSGGWAKRLLKGLVSEFLIIQDNLLRKRMRVLGNVIVKNPQEPCRRHLSGQSLQPRTAVIWHLLQIHMTENQWWRGSSHYISCLFRGSGVINNVEMSAGWKLRSIATNMLSPSRQDQKRPGGREGDECQFRSWNKLPLLSALPLLGSPWLDLRLRSGCKSWSCLRIAFFSILLEFPPLIVTRLKCSH